MLKYPSILKKDFNNHIVHYFSVLFMIYYVLILRSGEIIVSLSFLFSDSSSKAMTTTAATIYVFTFIFLKTKYLN